MERHLEVQEGLVLREKVSHSLDQCERPLNSSRLRNLAAAWMNRSKLLEGSGELESLSSDELKDIVNSLEVMPITTSIIIISIMIVFLFA